jgi:hypothetical protein
VQLWQQRVVQGLQHCDLRCNTLQHGGHGDISREIRGKQGWSAQAPCLKCAAAECCLPQTMLYIAATASLACHQRNLMQLTSLSCTRTTAILTLSVRCTPASLLCLLCR